MLPFQGWQMHASTSGNPRRLGGKLCQLICLTSQPLPLPCLLQFSILCVCVGGGVFSAFFWRGSVGQEGIQCHLVQAVEERLTIFVTVI